MKQGQFTLTADDDRRRFEARMQALHSCVYYDGRCLLHDISLLDGLSASEQQHVASLKPAKQRDAVKWKHKNY